MKFPTMFFAVIALVVNAFGSMDVFAEDAQNFPDGWIKFAGDKEGSTFACEIQLKNGDYLFNGSINKCENDKVNYFRLDTAPSATEITLFSDSHVHGTERWCQEDSGEKYGWEFTIRTYKHPVTTGWISIASLKGEPEGGIITKGIILVSKKYRTGDQIDELSCVRVKRSALP